jgi:hypothetical protein
MARSRRKKDAEPAEGDGAPIAKRIMPDVCLLCGNRSGAEMLTHLYSHAPAELCQRCEVKDKGWRLDLDGVQYFRADVSIFESIVYVIISRAKISATSPLTRNRANSAMVRSTMALDLETIMDFRLKRPTQWRWRQ